MTAQRGASLPVLMAYVIVLGLVSSLAIRIAPMWMDNYTLQGRLEKLQLTGQLRQPSIDAMRGVLAQNLPSRGPESVRIEEFTIEPGLRRGTYVLSYDYTRSIKLLGNARLAFDFTGSMEP